MELTHNFTPGTRAVAQQVNQNFADVKSAIDPLQTDVADIKTQLTSGIILPDGSVDFTRLQSYKTYTVSNATNATPIVITAVAHGFLTGDKVYISGVGGNTAANGTFTITKIGTDTFSLDGSVGNGAFTSNGSVIIYPSANKNLSHKAYVDNGDSENITQIGTCETATNNSTLTGTLTATIGSATITGSSTLFTTECPVGTTIVINGTPCYVSSVASNTSLTISQAYGNTTFTGTGYKANNEKVVTLNGFTLKNNITIRVSFTNKNLGLTPTLNVNSTGAKAIYNEAGTAVSATNPAYFPAGSTVEFTYNGTNWVFKKRVIENYVNGTSWYRVWSDGWIEQGGQTTIASIGSTIILLKQHANVNYNIQISSSLPTVFESPYITTIATTGFFVDTSSSTASGCIWSTKGY